MTTWWQRGAIYQIYPRSFADANGDGVGDLRGIEQRLEHLSALGVEAVWLSPIFPSPMADFGYDVADYCDIDPQFGTLEDFDALIARVPRARDPDHPRLGPEPHLGPAPVVRGVALEPRRPEARLVRVAGRRAGRRPAQRLGVGVQGRGPGVDASTRRPASSTCTRSSPSSPTSTGTTPRSRRRCTTCCASGSTAASTGCGSTRSRASPRTRCCATRRARRGRTTRTGTRSTSGCAAIRRVVDEYEDRMIVGEVALHDLHRTVSYLRHGDQLHLAHNFLFAEQDWDAEGFRTSIDDFEAIADPESWPAWFISNHDKSRGDDALRRSARRAAIGVMLYALRGTPFVYQGEELCLPDAEIPRGPGRRRRRPRPRARADPVGAAVGGGAGRGLHHRRAVAPADRRGGGAVRGAPGGRPGLRAVAVSAAGGAAGGQRGAADRQPAHARPRAAGCSPGSARRATSASSRSSTSSAPSRGRSAAEGSLILSSRPGREEWAGSLDAYEAVLIRLES